MGYQETNETPESFYIDSFVEGCQLELTQVIRSIGGAVEYDREARYLGKLRARYKITLPAGCQHTGLDEYLAPQTVTLPGGRALCVYPGEESVRLGWLPGDSANSALWNNDTRKGDTRKRPDVLQFHIYRSELPNLGETHIIVAWSGNTPRSHWGAIIDTVEGVTARDAAQVYLDRAGLRMPFDGMRTIESGSYFIVFKHQGGR